MKQKPPSASHTHQELEWALQEQALRAERLGLDESADPALWQYRQVVRALRQPLQQKLPLEFAADLAVEARRRAAGDTRLETYASLALLGVLVVVLLGVLTWYASYWAQLLALLLSQPWLPAATGLLALLSLGKFASVAWHGSGTHRT